MDRVTLRAGELSLELAPGFGGSVAAFRLGNIELMRPLPDGAARALYSGMFPMVPFANCIRDNAFCFAGRDYRVTPNMADSALNFHGSGWQLPWAVSEADEGHAVLRLQDAVVDDVYRFDASQSFSLDASGLSVSLTLTNCGPRTLPFSFGLHPWFPRHGAVDLRFAATGFWTAEPTGTAGELIGVPGNNDYSGWRTPPLSRQNNCYAGWAGVGEIAWPVLSVGLRVTADPVFSHLMFHVPASGEPTFCIEPQSNAPCAFDGLAAGRVQDGVFILAPGESISGAVRFAPLRSADFQSSDSNLSDAAPSATRQDEL